MDILEREVMVMGNFTEDKVDTRIEPRLPTARRTF